MILFFDTETTGFVNDRFPLDHEDQPHMVQLAAELCDDDATPLSWFSLIINPGVKIPARASDVHGITDERAEVSGVSPAVAVEAFRSLYQKADLVVAHNVKFDRAIIEIAISRALGSLYPLRKPLFCTMEASAPIINLPPTERMVAAGINKPKAPKLEEAVRHFFQEDLAGAHDAMVDLAACRRVYFHLQTLGVAA
jgi:DNA polymerase-3 subunit epsilon